MSTFEQATPAQASLNISLLAVTWNFWRHRTFWESSKKHLQKVQLQLIGDVSTRSHSLGSSLTFPSRSGLPAKLGQSCCQRVGVVSRTTSLALSSLVSNALLLEAIVKRFGLWCVLRFPPHRKSRWMNAREASLQCMWRSCRVQGAIRWWRYSPVRESALILPPRRHGRVT